MATDRLMADRLISLTAPAILIHLSRSMPPGPSAGAALSGDPVPSQDLRGLPPVKAARPRASPRAVARRPWIETDSPQGVLLQVAAGRFQRPG